MFEQLPPEIRSLCYTNLTPTDLFNLSLVNKQSHHDVQYEMTHPDFLTLAMVHNKHEFVDRILIRLINDDTIPWQDRVLEWVDSFEFACGLGYTSIVRQMLQNPVVYASSALIHANKDESLCIASEKGHTEIVEMIYTADPDLSHFIGAEDAFCNAVEGGHLDIVRQFIRWGMDIHCNQNYGILMACQKGNVELINVYLSVRLTQHQLDDALCIACEYPNANQLDIIRQLLVMKANVHNNGWYPFKYAHSTAVIHLLMSHVDQIFSADYILYHYCENKSIEFVQTLLAYSNIKVTFGEICLEWVHGHTATHAQ